MYLAFAEEHESLSSFQNKGKKMGAKTSLCMGSFGIWEGDFMCCGN